MNLQGCPPWKDDGDSEQARDEIEAKVERLLDFTLNLRSIGLRELEQIHEQMMSHCAPYGFPYYAGHVRQISQTMPCLAMPIQVNGVQCLEAKRVPVELAMLCAKIASNLDEARRRRKRKTISDAEYKAFYAASIAYAVGSFLKIHPFLNGNGRMSRVIWNRLYALTGANVTMSISRRPSSPADYTLLMHECANGKYTRLRDWIVQDLA